MRLEDPDSAPGVEGGEQASEAHAGTRYDPLFDPWDRRAARSRKGPDDDIFAYQTRMEPREDEYPSWARYNPASASAPPFRYGAGMTEAQQRLFAGTIAIPRRERRWVVTVRELAETLLLALLIFLAVRASFQNFRVEGASMQPSLDDGEYLIVNKLAYTQVDFDLLDWLPFFDAGEDSKHHLWSSPDRGDIIVFRAPTATNKDFIKRIIGLPGDTIEIAESTGRVKVNGRLVDEPYAFGLTHCAAQCNISVPEAGTAESKAACGSDACYFVMGDNRQNSSDSRQGWLVPQENIIGKALITYWHHGSPELDLAPNHSVSFANEE